MQNPNDVFEITPDTFAFGGAAVGRMADGKVCFVRGGIPGEKERVRLVSDRKKFAEAELVDIIEPSKLRVVPECGLAADGVCPGCSYQHVDYSTELHWKQNQLEHFLTRDSLADAKVFSAPFGSPKRFYWRNRLKLACEHGKLGYRGFDNTSLVPVTSCPLARKSINERLAVLSVPENVDGIYFRWTLDNGVVTSLDANYERKILTEQLGQHGGFFVSAHSFFQTNVYVAAELASYVARLAGASGAEKLAELYCGVGVFSIVCAAANEKLECRGVELDPDAIRSASINASKHGLAKRCSFFTGDAGATFTKAVRNFDPDRTLVIADPPRTGFAPDALEKLLEFAPKHIIYVSCSPDTLARDIARMKEKSYSVANARLFDMFPCTAHFETCVLLERKALRA